MDLDRALRLPLPDALLGQFRAVTMLLRVLLLGEISRGPEGPGSRGMEAGLAHLIAFAEAELGGASAALLCGYLVVACATARVVATRHAKERLAVWGLAIAEKLAGGISDSDSHRGLPPPEWVICANGAVQASPFDQEQKAMLGGALGAQQYMVMPGSDGAMEGVAAVQEEAEVAGPPSVSTSPGASLC